MADHALRTQLDRDWHFWMREHPELATQFGYPGQDDRWTDVSPEAIDRRAKYLRQSAASLGAIERQRLSPDAALNYDLYRDLLETAVSGLAFENEPVPVRGVIPRTLLMPINQLEGLPQDLPLTLSLMPTSTVEDYERIVSRLERVPALVAQTIALMERGLERGLTPPRVTFRGVPDQVRAQIVADPAASPLLAAFRRLPASFRALDRSMLAAGATAAFERHTRPAFAALHEFVANRYLPFCRDTTSVADLPDGEERYRYNLRWHLTLDITPEEIHAIGQSEVRRIRAEMDRVMEATGFVGGFTAFAHWLRTDPQFYFTDAGALLTAYRDIAKRADPELTRLFGHLPRTPYGVVPVPDATAPSSTTAYYQPGSLIAGRPGTFFANTYQLESRPKWEMEALTLHEAVPGHHLQIAIAQEFGALPEFRKHSSYTAFVEGWALYAESLGEAMGFYADPFAKFGQLTYEVWRAARLVVDTGLHALGWTRQQAIEFLAGAAPKTLADITVEVDRYIVWPGQALGYKMGQIKITELRASAERELGGAFDLRGFHDVLLRQGALPLDVLEAHVAQWVSARASRTTGTP